MAREWACCTALGVIALGCLAPSAWADDDLAAARALAVSHCSQCHTFGQGEPHGQGPNLFGLIGRQAGSAVGFHYSERFKAALGGRAWDAALLDRWLTDTQALAPGTGMVYWQDDAAKRATLIRYLASLH
ncbi:MAG: c-type cytochrome [Gammaproteobacteria bacterium]